MFKLAANMLLLGCLLLIVGGRILGSGANVQPDLPRYASAGLNVYQHGVLSPERYRVDHVPTPGFYAGGVFTAFEIALAAFLNDETYRDLVCIAIGAVDEVCGKELWSLKAICFTETVIFHLCVLFVGWIFFSQNIIAAWLCLVASLAFNDTYLYVSSPLSEPGYLMLGGLFMAA
ncbi:hypothetical protein [Thalassospira sp. MCCC 1A02491]|uniref:hypothetical protein n=1 Tax=Thalassospira sp. MCCC 1A02491 TaxID=1769751 RepID=UPI0007AD7161|nr:hypothetical protein [Thalassospira sp. MCCC 1A02491]KZB62730.1 hypothetical protein AUQ42_02960 [Thalassospira sp. MCCC 1A02491]